MYHSDSQEARLAVLLIAIWVAHAIPCARALDIIPRFDAAGSDAPDFDPERLQLQNLFEAAATVWEGIIQDSGTVVITFRYKDVDALANGTALLLVGGKPLTGAINVDSKPRPWFFDPTPLDNSEFEFVPRAFDELSSLQQTDWFDGAPPADFEVSYRGTALPTAPPDAVHGYDMFSTIVHEIGHVLGLSSPTTMNPGMAYLEAVAQGDFDFDISPHLVGDATMAIRTHGTNPNNVDDWSHLAAPSLMCANCAEVGVRRLPAATDVLAVASAAQWSQVDLPRKSSLGSGLWSQSLTWLGGRVPDSSDDVLVGVADDLVLNQDVNVQSLQFRDGGSIDVATHDLLVGSLELITRGLSSPSIRVGPGGRFAAHSVLIDQGSILVDNGTLGLISADVDGTIILAGAASQLHLGAECNGCSSRIRRSSAIGGEGIVSVNNDAQVTIDDGVELYAALENSGNLRLGDSYANISLKSFRQLASGVLEVDVAGGQEFFAIADTINVTGLAELTGAIRLTLHGAAMASGSQFTILEAAQIVDHGLSLIDDSGLFSLYVDQSRTHLNLIYWGQILSGDYNLDGFVDAADYTVWRDHLEQRGPALVADGNGDFIIDHQDYDVWSNAFLGSKNALNKSTVISEPTTRLTLTLLVLVITSVAPRTHCFSHARDVWDNMVLLFIKMRRKFGWFTAGSALNQNQSEADTIINWR